MKKFFVVLIMSALAASSAFSSIYVGPMFSKTETSLVVGVEGKRIGLEVGAGLPLHSTLIGLMDKDTRAQYQARSIFSDPQAHVKFFGKLMDESFMSIRLGLTATLKAYFDFDQKENTGLMSWGPSLDLVIKATEHFSIYVSGSCPIESFDVSWTTFPIPEEDFSAPDYITFAGSEINATIDHIVKIGCNYIF